MTLAAVWVASGVATVAWAGSVVYQYDELGRLKTATYSSDSTSTSYVLDAAGNRKSVTDTVPSGTVQFSASAASIPENGVSITLTVTRINGIAGAGSVTCSTTAGTAIAGSDFTATTTVLTWTNGESASKSCVVPIGDDEIVDGNKTFTVGLSAAGGVTIGTPNSVTVTITDDDTPGTLQFSASTAVVPESGPNISLTVMRVNGAGGAASVTCTTTAGTATAGSDYTTTSTILTWAAGDAANRSCTIPISDDPLTESSEAFTASLSGVTGATLGTPTTVTVTITDNDDGTPPTTPGTLSGAVISSSQVNLSWGASTDAGGSGLAGYKVERCTGSTCTTYAQIGTSTTTTYSDTTTAPLTTYRYRVQAYDNANPVNHSGYTNIVNVSTPDGYIQITDSSGAVLASAASLYNSNQVCMPAPPFGNVCTWILKKSYGTLATVWSTTVIGPACPAGSTAISTAGYQRPSLVSCQINALASVYGQ